MAFLNMRCKGSLGSPTAMRICLLATILLCFVSISSETPVEMIKVDEISPQVEQGVNLEENLSRREKIEKSLFLQDMIHTNAMYSRKYDKPFKTKVTEVDERKTVLKGHVGTPVAPTHSDGQFVYGSPSEMKAVTNIFDLDEANANIVDLEINYLRSSVEAKLASERRDFDAASAAIDMANRALYTSLINQRNLFRRNLTPVNPYVQEEVCRYMKIAKAAEELPAIYQSDHDQSIDHLTRFFINHAYWQKRDPLEESPLKESKMSSEEFFEHLIAVGYGEFSYFKLHKIGM